MIIWNGVYVASIYRVRKIVFVVNIYPARGGINGKAVYAIEVIGVC